MSEVRGTPALTALTVGNAAAYERIGRETGVETGIARHGSLSIARTPARFDELRYGMNLIAAADQPFLWRVIFFLIVLAVTGGITGFTIIRSKRLADLLDVLSDERVGTRRKWHAFLDSLRK